MEPEAFREEMAGQHLAEQVAFQGEEEGRSFQVAGVGLHRRSSTSSPRHNMAATPQQCC